MKLSLRFVFKIFLHIICIAVFSQERTDEKGNPEYVTILLLILYQS